MKAIGKTIVIETIKEKETTESGLLLTATDVDGFRYKKGLVIKEGTDVKAIKKNDTIYYDKSAGFSLLLNDCSYTIITERDIVVVL